MRDNIGLCDVYINFFIVMRMMIWWESWDCIDDDDDDDDDLSWIDHQYFLSITSVVISIFVIDGLTVDAFDLIVPGKLHNW